MIHGKILYSSDALKITVCLGIRKVILVLRFVKQNGFFSIRWFSSKDLVKEKKKKKSSTKNEDDRRKMMLHFQPHKTMKNVKSKQDPGNSLAIAKKNGFTEIISRHCIFLD